jgi:hypothetical protein
MKHKVYTIAEVIAWLKTRKKSDTFDWSNILPCGCLFTRFLRSINKQYRDWIVCQGGDLRHNDDRTKGPITIPFHDDFWRLARGNNGPVRDITVSRDEAIKVLTSLVPTAINNEILATSNDINRYLSSSVPLECYQKDIDIKLDAMRARVAKLLTY